jgi:vacuolar protein sorting-associated protein VTA1
MSSNSKPLEIPPELKKITVYIRRAEELDKGEKAPEKRIVSFYCREYAVSIGLPFATSSQAAKICLSTILNQLEKEKPIISTISRKEAESLIRKFANEVFTKADDADRACSAPRNTAKMFYDAASFFEILQQFISNKESLTEEQDEDKKKRVYCKWKATEILRAIKEGRIVFPGGYGELESARAQLSEVQSTSPPEDEAVTVPLPFIQPSAYVTSSKNVEASVIQHESEEEIQIVGRNAATSFTSNPQNGTTSAFQPPSTTSAPSLDDVTAPSKSLSSSILDTVSSLCTGPTPISDDSPAVSSVIPSTPSTIVPAPPSSPTPKTPSSVALIETTPSKNKSTLSSFFSGAFGIGNKAKSQGSVSKEDILDALELSIFAQKCLEEQDGELAVARLQAALECLGTT